MGTQKKSLNLDTKTELYCTYGIDSEISMDMAKSVYGEDIELVENNTWKNKINIFVPGAGNKSLNGLATINQHPVIDHSVRNFILHCVRSNVSFVGANILIDSIKSLQLDLVDEAKACNQIDEWIKRTLQRTDVDKSAAYTILKRYVEFSIDEPYWAFDESLSWSFPPPRPIKGKSHHRVSLLDPVYGPFSQSEIMQINNAINETENLSAAEKGLIMLCRDLGLRPIQIALLREQDISITENGPKIKIPRVKGSASALKRNPRNFVERDISKELYLVLMKNISENQKMINDHENRLREYCLQEEIEFFAPPRPIFCKKNLSDVAYNIYKHKGIRDYCLHLRNGEISIAVKQAGKKLAIKTTRGGHEFLLDVTPYRFRKTMATNMVLQGYTPEEIAYALDHLTLTSVRHYFKFNTEIIDFVNSVVNNSFEISQMVDYWKGRFVSKNDNLNNSSIRTVGGIGLCLKVGACEANPTVTCYSCNSFKPYLDTSHEQALEEIVRFRDEVSNHSSGSVKHQVEISYEMAKQCIKVQKELIQNEN